MDKVIEKWDEILQTVKRDYNISDVAFNTWLKPLEVYDVTDNVITILVPSEQVVLINLLNKKYKLLLQVTICELTGISECMSNSYLLMKHLRKMFLLMIMQHLQCQISNVAVKMHI